MNINKSQYAFAVTLFFALSATGYASVGCDSSSGNNLLLNTDFEQAEIKTDKKRNDDYLVTKSPDGKPVGIGIQYEGGGDWARYAKIAPGPVDSNNKVFHYWLKHATVQGQREGRRKGRVQMNVVGVNKSEICQHYRMYLHPDLNLYRSYPGENAWFVISTLWMGAKWKNHPHPFRISLNIVKPKGSGMPLYFAASGNIGVKGKGGWKTIWSEGNSEYEVPIGQWIDVVIAYKQGDKNNGRLYMSVQGENDSERTTIVDITNWTYHPDARKPVPLTHWNPLKLYTSQDIINYVRKNGGVTQIYWDDLKLYGSWPDSLNSAGPR